MTVSRFLLQARVMVDRADIDQALEEAIWFAAVDEDYEDYFHWRLVVFWLRRIKAGSPAALGSWKPS